MEDCEICKYRGKPCRGCAGLARLRANQATEMTRSIERERQSMELERGGMFSAAVSREGTKGGHQRAIVGHKSGFYSPAESLANAINDALKPDAAPPRRWVPKKYRRRPVEEYGSPISPEGKVLTSRYQTWVVEEVAKVNPGYLRWLMQRESVPPEMRARCEAALVAVGEPVDGRQEAGR